MAQGIGTFAGLTVLGVDFPHSRGVSPSTGLMRLVPLPEFDRVVSDLVLSYDGNSITLSDVAVASCPLEIFDGRAAFRWNAAIQDSRWKWRYPRINGRYNRRLCDGTVDDKGKKNARELGELLATELGGSINVDALPTSAYPPACWDDALARYELAWLCDLFALTVNPKNDNTYELEPITATASLPSGGTPITPPTLSYKPAVMPSKVQTQGSFAKKQGWVELQALGLDSDGGIKPLSACSWASSLATQWPNVFPDISDPDKKLAFQTAYRFYGPVDPTIILEDHVIETGLDATAERKRCLPPQVRGAFMSHDDFGTTTSSTAPYNGKFRIRKDWNAVEFHYPVYKVLGGMAPAELKINTAYYEIDEDGNPTDFYSKDKSVPKSVTTTKPRVLSHSELSKRQIIDVLYGGSAGDNTAALDAEADAYMNPVTASYDFEAARDVLYGGLIFPESVGISQRHWLVGNDRVATTRIGVNTEVDITSASNQQQRAIERLGQMAERLRI